MFAFASSVCRTKCPSVKKHCTRLPKQGVEVYIYTQQAAYRSSGGLPRRATNRDSAQGYKHQEPWVFPAPKPGAKKLRHACACLEAVSPYCTAQPLLHNRQYRTSPLLVTEPMPKTSIVKKKGIGIEKWPSVLALRQSVRALSDSGCTSTGAMTNMSYQPRCRAAAACLEPRHQARD